MFGTVDSWLIYVSTNYKILNKGPYQGFGLLTHINALDHFSSPLQNLTGGKDGGAHVTDVTNASRTMLMDIKSLKWSDKCLEFFGINPEILPEIRPSSAHFGDIKHPQLTQIEGIPIAGCLGDQHAALVGQHCFQEGEAKNTYGTGCFMLFNTGTEIIPSNMGLLTTVGYQFEGEPAAYALEVKLQFHRARPRLSRVIL